MEWQPIETAPRDGTLVFIKEKNGRVQVAKWCSPDGYHSDWHVQLTQVLSSDNYPTTNVEYWIPIPK